MLAFASTTAGLARTAIGRDFGSLPLGSILGVLAAGEGGAAAGRALSCDGAAFKEGVVGLAGAEFTLGVDGFAGAELAGAWFSECVAEDEPPELPLAKLWSSETPASNTLKATTPAQ